MDILLRIKSLIVRRQYRFTVKTADEMELDDLNEEDVLESILGAIRISKTLRSTVRQGERLYVIESRSYQGKLIYSKGTIRREEGQDIYYIFVSAKRSRFSE